MAFIVQFLQLWMLFCVYSKYGCIDMCEKVYSCALKWGLWHSKFYFMNIGVYFVLIGGMVTKIRAKISIRWIWNWVYGIRRSIFRILLVILRRLEVRLEKYGRKRFFEGFDIGCTAFAVLFIDHRRIFCADLRYGCKYASL